MKTGDAIRRVNRRTDQAALVVRLNDAARELKTTVVPVSGNASTTTAQSRSDDSVKPGAKAPGNRSVQKHRSPAGATAAAQTSAVAPTGLRRENSTCVPGACAPGCTLSPLAGLFRDRFAFSFADGHVRIESPRRHASRWITALLLIAAGLTIPSAALAQPPDRPRPVRLSVGFQDKYKVGMWTPVEVTFRGGKLEETGTVRFLAADADGATTSVGPVRDIPVSIGPGQDRTFRSYVKFGRDQSELTVIFDVQGRRDVRRTFDGMESERELLLPTPMDTRQKLIVSVGAPIGIDAALKGQDVSWQSHVEHARLTDTTALPTRWYGYEGVDVLWLSTSQPEIYRQLLDNSAQLAALDRWVQMGGKLVLCVGSAQAPLLLTEGQPLARFVPGTYSGQDATLSPSQLAAWEAYAGGKEPLPRPQKSGDGDSRLRVPLVENPRGRVVVPQRRTEGEPPLMIYAPYGFGEVLFLTVDLDQPPFSKWSGRGALVNRILDKDGKQELDEDLQQQFRWRSGAGDLASQLHAALDQFEGVQPVAFGLVALLVVGYILLIGPGDYLLVKRVLKRMELTWVTFPAIVLLVSLTAYVTAYWLKGDQLRVNQVELVDVDTATGLVRGSTWANIFSPRMSSYNVTLTPKLAEGAEPDDASVLLSWFGEPVTSWQGVRASGGGPLFSRTYEIASSADDASTLDQLLGVPIQVWSTKSFMARWYGSTLDYPKAELREADDRIPQGTIRNTLDVPLQGCLLVYEHWVYTIGNLAPGQEVVLDPNRPEPRRMKVETFLTNQQIVQREGNSQDFVYQGSQWDPNNADVRRILLQMMFYDASGGISYNRVTNGYQSYTDLSEHRRLGQAMLVGVAAGAGTAQSNASVFKNDGTPMTGPQDRRWTVYRFLYPIDASDAGG